ncbi:Sulfate permease, MFS superfamily [Flavobacteriaceae bacterium MAR_2010_188]|nr:Sulfate permease, MFS superfamily [Flavobacteriaceae bacterium MAR_2010_188]
MSPKKNRLAYFFKKLPANIFSGFVVSLIALPLGLGLAMASEAPAIAGVITAIVGGVVVSIFGGSHVTITGPGNGMVGVLLIAITTLGLMDAYTAIVCSGFVLMLLGFLRMGKLSDFFPSSAIQGMLAAIGLIILGKQFHIMLANRIVRDSTLGYLLEIPNTILKVFTYDDKGLIYAALSGVISLAIMLYYPKFRNKYLQLIPAPMWIVILSIGFSYFHELVLDHPNPIDPNYMLPAIPSITDLFNDLPEIRFNGIWNLQFWSSVFGLTFIASIESLLSIKAIDNLDPEKHRSNVNKDLKALGIATIGSGFLGGLNVVTVIARSSVNVNNGGNNRSANFSHAIFLLLFIGLFSTQLTRIPLPALMAILVFTGYKLASPKLVRRMFSVGSEQLLIFLVTLVGTLRFGLISGIGLGILLTFLVHGIINKNVGMFLRNWLKPNVLMYKEDGEGEIYYISVKHFCNFLNYYRLKEKIDAVSEDNDVVIDFSMCVFVDHTVMDNLHSYQEVFRKQGGHLEIVGLDSHQSDSTHPFALKRLLPVPKFIEKNLTKRQFNIGQIAENFNYIYNAKKGKNLEFLNGFYYFETKQISHIYNTLINSIGDYMVFDIEYSEGAFIAKEDIRSTMMYIELHQPIPVFTLSKENLIEKIYGIGGHSDIDIQGNEEFSKRFYLYGEDEVGILKFFSDSLILFFESIPYYHIESNGKWLLIFNRAQLAGDKEIKTLLDFGKRLKSAIIAE